MAIKGGGHDVSTTRVLWALPCDYTAIIKRLSIKSDAKKIVRSSSAGVLVHIKSRYSVKKKEEKKEKVDHKKRKEKKELERPWNRFTKQLTDEKFLYLSLPEGTNVD